MSGAAPQKPPSDVTPISIEDLTRLGIDSSNRLFWDGKRIEIRQSLDLTRVQEIFAIIVAVFAVLGGLGGLLSGLTDLAGFLCARHITWLSCPMAK